PGALPDSRDPAPPYARPSCSRAPPELAGRSVRWAGRRADVARDADRFRRRLRRLRLFCRRGLYENTGRRAAKHPPRSQRAAAGTDGPEPGAEPGAAALCSPRQRPA
ncbi:Hypothetical predicted protein, partial [Marmota monax]